MRKNKLQQIAEMELGSKLFKYGSIEKAKKNLADKIYCDILMWKHNLCEADAIKVQEKMIGALN